MTIDTTYPPDTILHSELPAAIRATRALLSLESTDYSIGLNVAELSANNIPIELIGIEANNPESIQTISPAPDKAIKIIRAKNDNITLVHSSSLDLTLRDRANPNFSMRTGDVIVLTYHSEADQWQEIYRLLADSGVDTIRFKKLMVGSQDMQEFIDRKIGYADLDTHNSPSDNYAIVYNHTFDQLEFRDISAVVAGDTYKVKWDAADTEDFLENKIPRPTTAGAILEVNAAGNAYITKIIYRLRLLRNYTDITAALSDIGSEVTTLIIDEPVTLSADLTVGANVSLDFRHNGSIDLNGYDFTTSGPIVANATQIFSGSGTIIYDKSVVPTIHVAWFGAVGDDSTNDTTALTRAISVFASNGGTLVFEPGSAYRHDAEFNISNVDDLVFDGQGATIAALNGTSTSAGHGCLIFNSCNNITVKNFALDGNRANRTLSINDNYLLRFIACDDCVVLDVDAINSCLDGFNLAGDTASSLSNRCHRCKFVRCSADNSYRLGFSILAGYDIGIDSCRFTNSNGTSPQGGIDIEPNAGVLAPSAENIIITNSSFSGHAGAAVTLYDGADVVGVRISKCNFSDSHGGIAVYSNDTIITDCVFDDFTAGNSVIHVRSNANRASIANNIIKNCALPAGTVAGILVESGATDVIISGNILHDFTDTHMYGIHNSAENTIIIGNIVRDILNYATILAGDGVSLINNVIIGARYTGAYVTGKGARLIGNTVLDITDCITARGLLHVTSSGERAVIKDNVIKLSTADTSIFGISIASVDNVIIGNMITGLSTSNGGIQVSGDINRTFYGCNNGDGSGNSPLELRRYKLNDKVVTARSAAPTSGAWEVGDRVYNTNPTSGGYIGWVCTVAGTPGTWNTFGVIS